MMRLRTFLKPLSFLPAIFMMYIIFMFSAQDADLSSSISARASYMIVKAADYVFDVGLEDWQIEEYSHRIHGVTRKVAHMTEYFLLAVAVSFPLYVYGLHGIALVFAAGLFCVAFACTDEYHQSYVAGRAASFKDVGIDSFGVLIGIILVRIIGWTGRHTIFAPDPEEKYRRSRKEMKELRRQQAKMQKQLNEERSFYINSARSGNADRSSAPPIPDRYSGPYGADPDYDRYEEYEDLPESPDDLSDDMPFSHLLKRR